MRTDETNVQTLMQVKLWGYRRKMGIEEKVNFPLKMAVITVEFVREKIKPYKN